MVHGLLRASFQDTQGVQDLSLEEQALENWQSYLLDKLMHQLDYIRGSKKLAVTNLRQKIRGYKHRNHKF